MRWIVEGANPAAFRHRAQAPVRRIPRRRLKGLANDLGDLVIADLARRAGTGLVIETRDVRRTAAAIFLRC
jgi:hypothetical protein